MRKSSPCSPTWPVTLNNGRSATESPRLPISPSSRLPPMTFPSIRIEGTILSGELLVKLDSADSLGQRPADFGFGSQAKLKDEIVRSWTAAQAFYKAFQHKLEGMKEGTAATSETRNQWIIPLLGLLG